MTSTAAVKSNQSQPQPQKAPARAKNKTSNQTSNATNQTSSAAGKQQQQGYSYQNQGYSKYGNEGFWDPNCQFCHEQPQQRPSLQSTNTGGPTVNSTGQYTYSSHRTDRPVEVTHQYIEVPRSLYANLPDAPGCDQYYQPGRRTRVTYTVKELSASQSKAKRSRDQAVPSEFLGYEYVPPMPANYASADRRWYRLADDRNVYGSGAYVLAPPGSTGISAGGTYQPHLWNVDQTIGQPTTYLQFHDPQPLTVVRTKRVRPEQASCWCC
eukprot:Protomagalhaensia_wolfi_Nauph_80__636@NODE_1361_length_1565_cov_39_544561_g1053_i0_p1_GENE_NODE_1361_length_1565_cov_39_544561_g1053_i0NODE_1361_length_1565_cov_39_544561_g1053_i0_p1_ORF_typecomplete_len267_score23_76_NODE_1361_length_1565_cov_39_544561_g1053_i0120920